MCVCVSSLKILTSHSQTIRKRSPTEPRQEPHALFFFRSHWWWWLVVGGGGNSSSSSRKCMCVCVCPETTPTVRGRGIQRTEVAAYCSLIFRFHCGGGGGRLNHQRLGRLGPIFEPLPFLFVFFNPYQLKRCSKLTCCTSVCLCVSVFWGWIFSFFFLFMRGCRVVDTILRVSSRTARQDVLINGHI